MGKPDNPYSVVDPQLKVYGIQFLRVVDASVMPVVPVGNTNSPTIMYKTIIIIIIRISLISCLSQDCGESSGSYQEVLGRLSINIQSLNYIKL